MADQDSTRMFQYIVSQLCNPHDMPTPDIDVTSGVVDRRNLPDYEHTWNRQLAEQGQKVDKAANALERCIELLGA
eukprot:9882422-Lingulodinium_polyedra.AAC.1